MREKLYYERKNGKNKEKNTAGNDLEILNFTALLSVFREKLQCGKKPFGKGKITDFYGKEKNIDFFAEIY